MALTNRNEKWNSDSKKKAQAVSETVNALGKEVYHSLNMKMVVMEQPKYLALLQNLVEECQIARRAHSKRSGKH